jgi:hypothetical protein
MRRTTGKRRRMGMGEVAGGSNIVEENDLAIRLTPATAS